MSAAAAKMMRQQRITILLSLNAVAILIAGVLIASAIGLTGNGGLHVVEAENDVIDGGVDELALIDATSESKDAPKDDTSGSSKPVQVPAQAEANTTTAAGEQTNEEGKATGGNVPAGEFWSETEMTIYASADKDICIDDSLPGYSDMYWQSSNKSVISSFYKEARSYLGYNTTKCRYPVIAGTGTTVITAGTYDGSRRDSITVKVVNVPVAEWKNQVLNLVNAERAKAGLGQLAWGNTCAGAANTRATELVSKYDHTRPDGSSWSTLCPVPATGGMSGENIAAGASVPSPALVVKAWMNSPTHKANILNANFKFLSVGLHFDLKSTYKIYWDQYFTTY